MSLRDKTPQFFGPFCLDPQQRSVSRNGVPVTLSPKEFDTLLALVEAKGRVLSREELINQVWPNSYVGDGSLTRNISVLRKALGEGVIETAARRGYRLAIPLSNTGSSYKLDGQIDAPVSVLLPAPVPAQWWKGSSSWLTYATVALLIGAVAALLNRASVSLAKMRTPGSQVRVAVLPFANYSGTPGNDYLCDGMTEAVISELGRVSKDQMEVIARTSSMKYKNTDLAIPEIARQLNADFVLESSIRSSGDRLRLTIQLVRGSDASHVWTGEYERNLRNILDLQEQISIAVAQEIQLKIDSTIARGQHSHPVDPEAYQDYLLGRYYWNKRNQRALVKSLDYFKRALARDPKYAPAYAGLADAYLVLGGGYMSDIEAYGKAREAALKAIELDGALADPYTSLAYEQFVDQRDLAAADDNYQRALALDPNNANAHHWYALCLSATKRFDEAILHIRRALELDPLAIAVHYNAAQIYISAGRYDEAVQMAQRALEIDGSSAPAHGTLAVAYRWKGLYPQAIAEFQTAQNLRAGYSPYAVEVAHMYALAGKKDRARALLTSLLSDRHWSDVAPYSFAVTYATLGQKEKAFHWLERCANDHSCTPIEFNNDRDLDSLRSDSRFSQFVQ